MNSHNPTTPAIRTARVFDLVDSSDGPGFHRDHPRVTDPADREGLLEYLRNGAVLMHTTSRINDVLDPGRPAVVPVDFRTDGTWIWTDTVMYYLEQHGLEPDPRLAEHIRGRGYQVPPVTEDDLLRALAVARQPARRPTWTHRP